VHPDAESQESAVQTFPSSQLRSECTQLVAPQESTVQAFPSSQLWGVPLWQVPLLQKSPAVHVLPSLQGALLGVKVQAPVLGTHASLVQGLLSLQKTKGDAMHWPRWQKSIVQRLLSHSCPPWGWLLKQPPRQKPGGPVQAVQTQVAQEEGGGQRLLSAL